jgi:hypothetical protein
VAETRIPVPKPKAELAKVSERGTPGSGETHTIRFVTPRGKVFEREEAPGRGLMWYQVVESA